ncbi:MAG: hypothetical protein H7A34_01835 [bacterium]|nr:hypothetical protein [bacterium]
MNLGKSNKIRWWDEYEIKARYIPTFLSVIPIVHCLVLFLGVSFWSELCGNITWMLITNLSLAFILMLSFVQVQCGFAKHWIEESVFGKGGEQFPTTDMLLYNGGLISIERKEQIRDKITKLFGCIFSTKSEESNNPANARLQAREAVGHVRKIVGKGVMTHQYNIRYGFFRNLIAGMIWSATGSTGCVIIYAMANNWRPAVFFIIWCFVCLAMFFLKNKILKKVAFGYADSLFNEFLDQYKNKGDR